MHNIIVFKEILKSCKKLQFFLRYSLDTVKLIKSLQIKDNILWYNNSGVDIMILEEFDETFNSTFDPYEVENVIEGFPKTGVTCFSKKVIWSISK